MAKDFSVLKLIVAVLATVGITSCSSKNCDNVGTSGLCGSNPKTSISTKDNFDQFNGIIGGRAVNENWKTAKSTVAVYDKVGQALCTGTLISPNVVLTAAHCVSSDFHQMVIIFNQDLDCDPGTSLEVRNVENAVQYPSWSRNQDKGQNTGDVALVKFSGSVPVDFEIAQVIQNVNSIQNGSDVVLAGYGVNDGKDNSGSGKLRQVHVHVGNVHFSDSEIQIDQKDGVGACHGDSGGPAFVVNNGVYYLWGITSRGEDGCNSTSIYTRVDYYLPWIKSTISKLK